MLVSDEHFCAGPREDYKKSALVRAGPREDYKIVCVSPREDYKIVCVSLREDYKKSA